MDELAKISIILKEKDNFLISSHIRLDGDAIGSQLALSLALDKLGKKVAIINQDNSKKRFSFLPFFDRIRNSWKEDEKFDVSIILDCGKWSRIGTVEPLAKKSQIVINLDHHRDSQGIGLLNYINPDVSSTGEIIYNLLSFMDIEIDINIAICLYVAVLTDTGRFRYSNTGANSHRIAAELIDKGISSEEVINNILSHETPQKLKLYSEIIDNLRVNSNKTIVWSYINRTLQNKYIVDLSEIESDKIFDDLRTLKGFNIFLLFFDMPDGRIKVNIRSNYGVDVSPVARLLGGGGHPQACSAIVEGNFIEIEQNVIEKLEKIYMIN